MPKYVPKSRGKAEAANDLDLISPPPPPEPPPPPPVPPTVPCPQCGDRQYWRGLTGPFFCHKCNPPPKTDHKTVEQWWCVVPEIGESWDPPEKEDKE